MKISIITVTFNSESTIADCITSVNNQTYNNIEHIIIDGASKDNTVNIIKSLPNRVKKIISEPDLGVYDAFNKGIKLANGDILGFLHSDDLFFSQEILSKIQSTLVEKDTDGVYGNLVLVEQKETDKILRYWKSQTFKSKLLHRGWMPAHPTLFLKKEVYEKHGLFDLGFKISADYDLMLRIFTDADLKFVYLPEVITKMRVGGASNGSFKKFLQKIKEDYHVLLKKNSNPVLTLFLKKISKIIQYL